MMNSYKIDISNIGSRQSRPQDHFKDGKRLYLDIDVPSDVDFYQLLELLRSDKVYVTNRDPKNYE